MSRGRTQCQALVSRARQSRVRVPISGSSASTNLSLLSCKRTITVSSEHFRESQKANEEGQGWGTAGPQQMFPLFSLWLQETLSWPPVFSHGPSTSPCPSFDEDKQDESLLAENWGPRSWTTRWGRGWRRGETRELELLELQSDTNLAFSQASQPPCTAPKKMLLR